MDTPEFIVARHEIQERMQVRRGHGPQENSLAAWRLWPALKWLGPMLLAAGFERTLSGLAGRLGLGWLVPKSFSRR